MSNINPIFSIEYPNLDTLLFIRKQYPQLADMEIGTSIIDEGCIIAHYLPDEDKPCQVAEELIYFGMLLATTKHFHRTDDQYDLVYRCVSLRHEAKPEQSNEKVTVMHARNNDVLTITYPRYKTVFSAVNFKVPNLTLVPQTDVINAILFILEEEFGTQPEVRLYIEKDSVLVHIFDFTRFCIGAKTTIEDVVPNINASVLGRKYQGEPWVEINRTDEVSFVNQDDLKFTTLGDLLRQHFANSQENEESITETEPVEAKGGKTPEVSCVDMGHKGPYTLEELFAKIAEQKQAKSSGNEKPHTGFKPDEVVPLQGGEHSVCKGKQFDAGVVGYIVKEVKSEKFKSLLGHVDVAYDPEADQLTITYPLDKTVLSTFNLSSTDIGGWLENITSISDSVRTIIKMEYNLKAEVCSLVNEGKFKIYINDITRIAEDVEGVIKNIVPKVNALVLKPQFNANRFA